MWRNLVLEIFCIYVLFEFNLSNATSNTELDQNGDILRHGSDDYESILTPDSDAEEYDRCTLSVDAGPCDVLSVMFYYDQMSESCEKFTYGGCLGNENKFYDYTDCEEECMKNKYSEPNVCNEPIEIGNCTYQFDQFYYNASSNECETFIYTGCNGNGNRFHDLQSCTDVCKIPEDICKLPADPGVGPYSAPFFFYNSVTGACESFLYRGALGNDNRFYDAEECHNMCHN